MTNQDKDKKNQTTDQVGESSRNADTADSRQSGEINQDTSIDLSAVDRQEGNMEHGETGGHQLSGGKNNSKDGG